MFSGNLSSPIQVGGYKLIRVTTKVGPIGRICNSHDTAACAAKCEFVLDERKSRSKALRVFVFNIIFPIVSHNNSKLFAINVVIYIKMASNITNNEMGNIEDGISKDSSDLANNLGGKSENLLAEEKQSEEATNQSGPGNGGDEEELEEGELKDDDDDDDDEDEDKVSNKDSSQSSDDSDADQNNHKPVTSSSASSAHESRNSSRSSSRSGKENGKDKEKEKEADVEVSKEDKGELHLKKSTSSPKSSSSSDLKNDSSRYSSRHGSSSRQSPHSHRSHSKRRHSPVSSQQARLVSMRAKLLEAKSREIEMKFAKGKPVKVASSTTSTISLGPTRNLKTTIAKPPITYCENPTPTSVSPPPVEAKRKSKKQKTTKHESSKSSSSKKSSKKRKKKSSSSSTKKRKKSKTSESPKKSSATVETKLTNNLDIPHDNIVADRQGPRTPPDNLVTMLDDEQIEWPSYLIKMTTTQPSISYSVNPDSVLEPNSNDKSDTADLNSDYNWYYNYLVDTYDMDKSQAHHQACSTIISSDNYDKDLLSKWLEQRGLEETDPQENNAYPFIPNGQDDQQQDDNRNLPLRQNKPTITTLKLRREITLPNGKSLPAGTIEKIVHPYPRSNRVVPEVYSTYHDLY